MKRYNIAVIGCGSMGKTHSYSIASIPFYYPDCGFKPVLHTLVSRDTENAERYGFLHHAADFDSIINDPEIDIVDICTPNTLHYPQAKAALLAGKHVFCEKPLAATYDEALELAGLSEKTGLVTGLNFQNRFWSAAIRAKQLIDEGALGEIITFRAAFLHSSSLEKDKPYAWRYAPFDEGGGVLIDLGSHIFDILNYLVGEIESVHCVTKTLHGSRTDGDGKIQKVTSDDAAFMTATLKNGAVGTIEATKLATGFSDSLKVELHGTKGALLFDHAHPDRLMFFDAAAPDSAYGGMSGFTAIECMQRYPAPCSFKNGKNPTGGMRAHIHCYYSFLESVHRGTPFSPSFTDGLYVQKIIQKAKHG